jgi:hypothetical protein
MQGLIENVSFRFSQKRNFGNLQILLAQILRNSFKDSSMRNPRKKFQFYYIHIFA